MVGLPFLYGVISRGELSRGPLDLGRGLFAALFLLFGLTLGVAAGWVARRMPVPRHGLGSVVGYGALALVGVLGLGTAVVVALLIYFGIGIA